MQYEYHYDIVSIIAVIFLIAIYLMRQTYRTKANKIIFALFVCDLLGACFDIASCFSISYPERFPMWYNYLTTLGYLFFYNMTGMMFFIYIDARTKITRAQKPVRLVVTAIALLECFLILSSPVTHLTGYFDENMVYSHGPLMFLLYVFAASLLGASTVLFYARRRTFNRYQIIAIASFVVAVFVGVLLQLVWPWLLVGQFACTLVMFFLYISLETPTYYTYNGTTCYNRIAFMETIKEKLHFREPLHLFAFGIKDYDYFRENLNLKDLERMSINIAQFVTRNYRTTGFCIADDKFVIMVKNETDVDDVRRTLEAYFSKLMSLVSCDVMVSAQMVNIWDIDPNIRMDMMESGIIYLLENTNANMGENADFSEIVKRIERRKSISYIVKKAAEEDLFEVYYQPIRNVATGTFTSVEALVRLKDTKLGFISPEEFIPIAESEGIIYRIGELVFEKVCKFIWENRPTECLGVDYIEINLSPLQCFQPDIVERFTGIMKKYDVEPSWINLEITETASFEGGGQMLLNINSFHDMGITFSLDDYGSGFASADYLFKLPVDIVKIDKSILWQAMKDENARIVLISTLQMLKKLGKHIVVEGVEDETMVQLLTENGCDYMQGYYYSKPIPTKEYVNFLKKNM